MNVDHSFWVKATFFQVIAANVGFSMKGINGIMVSLLLFCSPLSITFSLTTSVFQSFINPSSVSQSLNRNTP